MPETTINPHILGDARTESEGLAFRLRKVPVKGSSGDVYDALCSIKADTQALTHLVDLLYNAAWAEYKLDVEADDKARREGAR